MLLCWLKGSIQYYCRHKCSMYKITIVTTLHDGRTVFERFSHQTMDDAEKWVEGVTTLNELISRVSKSYYEDVTTEEEYFEDVKTWLTKCNGFIKRWKKKTSSFGHQRRYQRSQSWPVWFGTNGFWPLKWKHELQWISGND